jgi:hypothetical protein
MADIVNLNQYRKKKALEAKKVRAARNRVKEGQPKSRRTAERLARERGEDTLDGKTLKNGDDD